MGYKANDRLYLARHIVIVCFGHNGELFKDVMYELWRDDNLHLAVYRLRTRVDELAGFAALLTLSGCLS